MDSTHLRSSSSPQKTLSCAAAFKQGSFGSKGWGWTAATAAWSSSSAVLRMRPMSSDRIVMRLGRGVERPHPDHENAVGGDPLGEASPGEFVRDVVGAGREVVHRERAGAASRWPNGLQTPKSGQGAAP